MPRERESQGEISGQGLVAWSDENILLGTIHWLWFLFLLMVCSRPVEIPRYHECKLHFSFFFLVSGFDVGLACVCVCVCTIFLTVRIAQRLEEAKQEKDQKETKEEVIDTSPAED